MKTMTSTTIFKGVLGSKTHLRLFSVFYLMTKDYGHVPEEGKIAPAPMYFYIKLNIYQSDKKVINNAFSSQVFILNVLPKRR